jgi:putative ABC transport system ATP-binding protein
MSTIYNLQNIKKSFQSGGVFFQALRGIDLQIPEGIMMALQGPSGSGKSTLLNVLGLLEQASEGQMSFFGKQIDFESEQQMTQIRRDSIGFIFQNFNLVPILSAAENIQYPLLLEKSTSDAEAATRVKRTLEAVGLENFAHHRPSQLSGGQRQRVAIGRALIKNPKVILADEPTANLDSKNATMITGLLKDLQRTFNTTVIIATHDHDVARVCDQVCQIKDGSVVR